MLKTIFIMILVAAISGCANVKPWERGYLAKKEMALEPDPIDAGLKQHIYSSKESSNGGYGVGGGGCGCN